MDRNEFLDKMAAGTMTRRDFKKALAAAGLALVTMPLTRRRASAGTKPLIFEWSGYEVPELHQAYIDKYGESPEFSFFGEEEEALQKMRSGFKPDTCHPCVENVLRYRLAGVVKPLDKSRLVHWDDMWPTFKKLDAIWHGDDLYMIPFDWGNSSILYRTDLVDIDEESWNLLWDKRYAGRMASYDSISNIIVAGLITGAHDPFDMTPEELKRAADKVREQRELMAFYWTGISNVEQALASGELVAAYAWNEGLVHLQEQGVPVKFMTPKEGILTWVCGIMRGADGPGDEEMVYDWINAMTSPEAGKFLIEDYGYGHSNRKAFDLVPHERLVELGIEDPDKMLATSIFFKTMRPELEDEYNRVFEEIKAGL